jgi:NAD(P) transhydrogenase subunit alpha
MTGSVDPIIINITIFVLAIFVGYHIVWNVTPALHTPLMSVTNAIRSVVMVGAILAAGSNTSGYGSILGGIAVALVATNTFGGFMVTHRMLRMFKKKDRSAAGGREAGQMPRNGLPERSQDVGRVPRSGPAEQAEGRGGPSE